MDYRKIIKFGNSSHVISLPNSWIKKNNLQKGDKVYFEENSNDELILYGNSEDTKKNLKEIEIDGTNKSIDSIGREIISSYINNYNIIKIVDKDLDKKSNDIRKFINELLGLEVIEQNNKNIISKDFLNVKEISYHGIIKRTDLIIKNMLKNSKDCFKGDYCNSINNNDLDVNRLYYISGRITRNAVENPKISKELDLTTYELMNLWQIMINLENFADECKRVARLFIKFNSKKSNIEELFKIYNEIDKMYNETMESFYNKNKELAYKTLGERKLIFKKLSNILEKSSEHNVIKSIEKLKNMVGNIKQILRIVVDMSM